MDEKREEFIVQGEDIQSCAFADLLKQMGTIEVVAEIANDVVVLRMAEQDRDIIAAQFGKLNIEPNTPLKRL